MTDAPRIIRRPEVLRRTGLSKWALAKLEAKGQFPRRVALAARAVGWYEAEVNEWIESRERL